MKNVALLFLTHKHTLANVEQTTKKISTDWSKEYDSVVTL